MLLQHRRANECEQCVRKRLELHGAVGVIQVGWGRTKRARGGGSVNENIQNLSPTPINLFCAPPFANRRESEVALPRFCRLWRCTRTERPGYKNVVRFLDRIGASSFEVQGGQPTCWRMKQSTIHVEIREFDARKPSLLYSK